MTDPARLASYKIAARRMVSFVSVLLAGAIGLSAVFASHTLWIPVERLTFEDESRVDGALVVEETPNWITYMTLADGTFATRNADEVARRTFCTYAWVKSAYEVEC